MAAIDQLVAELERTYEEAQERMSDPEVFSDRQAAAAAGRRLKELEAPYRLAQAWRQARRDSEEARADPELSDLVGEYDHEVERLEADLKLALAERDPNDAKDVIVEIRQGVGGNEAALWAADLLRMLTRYAERRGFGVEVLGSSGSEAGGFKEATLAVKGEGAYSVFKWEAGTHRVQRVPVTESQGRIHTSTATVAVMPEAEEVEKSQLQNKQKALRVLRARLHDLERQRQEAELSQARRAQIGSGERSEKIRTYNFPESRVTDHRIKLTLHRLDAVLAGELDEFTEALAAEEQRRALEVSAVSTA
jgi:peptide chain release factor 1